MAFAAVAAMLAGAFLVAAPAQAAPEPLVEQTLTLSATPDEVITGEPFTLTWASTGIDEVRASIGWPGKYHPAGSEPLGLNGSIAMTRQASNEGGVPATVDYMFWVYGYADGEEVIGPVSVHVRVNPDPNAEPEPQTEPDFDAELVSVTSTCGEYTFTNLLSDDEVRVFYGTEEQMNGIAADHIFLTSAESVTIQSDIDPLYYFADTENDGNDGPQQRGQIAAECASDPGQGTDPTPGESANSGMTQADPASGSPVAIDTLAATGSTVDSRGPLALVGLLLAAGSALMLVRRRQA